MIEQAVSFKSREKQLIAIEHLALSEQPSSDKSSSDKSSSEKSLETRSKKGVVIVVGGPQTRVGSHRLFVYLARALADIGISVFRFDYTGAGDSEGDITNFTDIQADIDAAINCFSERNPEISKISLWGLCDAASAILLYLQQYPQQQLQKQKNIAQLILINPWVRQEHTQAKTYLRSYYVKRFFSVAFWQKLLTGNVNAQSAMSDIKGFHQQSQSGSTDSGNNFVTAMLLGIKEFSGQIDIVLSGNDLTADEFKLLVKTDKQWKALMSQNNDSKIRQHSIEQADHTFSQRDRLKELIKLTCKVLATQKS